MHRPSLWLSLALLLTFLGAVLASTAPAYAVAGTPDRVRGASLLIPFFQTGIDAAVNPDDTLWVVTNTGGQNFTIHFQVWDVEGEASGVDGNIVLGANESWSQAMRDLLSHNAEPADLDQLRRGGFYRGFVTIDLVTASTHLLPTEADYPFNNGSNPLEGVIYYTRLSQGSANGLPMVPLEAVSDQIDEYLRGFYSNGDRREEIDIEARVCAANKVRDLGCVPGGFDHDIDRIDLRHFGSQPLNGASTLVVFAWLPGVTGGPSTICAQRGNCDETYTYRRYDEQGVLQTSFAVSLDDVVTVINVPAIASGLVSIQEIPSIDENLQIYAFALNSASPDDNPALTWDAIFEACIVP